MTNSPLAEDRIKRPQAFLPIAEPLSVAAVLREHPDLMPSPQALSDFVLEVLGRDTE